MEKKPGLYPFRKPATPIPTFQAGAAAGIRQNGERATSVFWKADEFLPLPAELRVDFMFRCFNPEFAYKP
jgi:hypothetical protein